MRRNTQLTMLGIACWLVLGGIATAQEDNSTALAKAAQNPLATLVTLPLHGTWAEFLDIYREVLTKHDRHETLESLNAYEATLPEPERRMFLEQAAAAVVLLVGGGAAGLALLDIAGRKVADLAPGANDTRTACASTATAGSKVTPSAAPSRSRASSRSATMPLSVITLCRPNPAAASSSIGSLNVSTAMSVSASYSTESGRITLVRLSPLSR